ncbi:hypothetical protein BLA13014_06616 [Burkholderia aenigmatica]|uniref:Uncharacterized protein n=1 Tax=Burkholderia aenigmatica TaxID=2015348 RepID=A0A6P2RZ96_9BURK|nr:MULTISPECIES: hypothetical protein [Burkholderia]VWC37070.1 hypothetical protein BLA13014_06616 [Burkholderia aenigmatica]
MYVLLAIFFPAISAAFIIDLRRNRADVIAVITFVFWLTSVVTPILTETAIALGAIGSDGVPLTEFGSFLKNTLLKHSYDLLGGIGFYIAIFSMVVVPQAATFICCGVFGCAVTPKFISAAYNVVVWGAAKTFTIAGGVLMSFTTYAHFFHPDWIIFDGVHPTTSKMLVSFSLGAAAFSGALMCLWVGFGWQSAVERLAGVRVGKMFARIKEFAVRYQYEN